MNSVIIIGDENLSLDKLEKIDFDGCNRKYIIDFTTKGGENKQCLVLEYGDRVVYCDYDEDTSDYEEDELEKINIVNPRFIAVSYPSKEVLKKVILSLKELNNIIIDDDHGNILGYSEYCSRFLNK